MILHRHFELRYQGNGIITGTVLRYGDVAAIGHAKEVFEPGSIRFDDVILNLLHDRGQPVARTGAGLELTDTHEALSLRADMPDTIYGRRARELIDARILRGLSAEFVPLKEAYDGNVRVIKEAALYGIGIVDRPAYPQSVLDRSAVFPAGLRVRQSGLIEGLLPWRKRAIVSLARRRMIELTADIEVADDVYLLNGYDYNESLASSGSGSMMVEHTADGIAFETRRLPSTGSLREVRRRIRAGLLNGVTPGLQVQASEEYEFEDYLVQRVTKGILCEINLVARQNSLGGIIAQQKAIEASVGERLGIGRRRRWLF